jgi:hypothetical protein
LEERWGKGYLNASGISHSCRCKHKAEEDTSDGAEVDSKSAESGVDEQVHDGDEDDQSDGVDVLQEIVGDTVQLHFRGLRDEIVEHLVVADPVDGEEDEDSASDQRTADFIDKEIVPVGLVLVTSNTFLVRGLGGFEGAIADTDPDDLEGVEDDGATGRAGDVAFAANDQDEDGEEEDAKGKEESSPETDVGFELGGCHRGETANVDGPVEPGVHRLDGDGGIDNDALAFLGGLDESLGVLVLFDDEGRDVGFDSTSAESNHNHGGDETSKVGRGAGFGDGSADEDELTTGVDQSEDQDGPIPSQILVRNDGAENGGDVAPKLEKVRETSRALLSKTQSTNWVAIGTRLVVLLKVSE